MKKLENMSLPQVKQLLIILKKSYSLEKFFHIGPPRDFDLFNDFKNNKSKDLDNSEYLLCTGLFDDHDNRFKFL